MTQHQFLEVVKQYSFCERGDTAIRTTLWLGAVALGVAVLAAPVLERASRTYADARSYGIDNVLTGSINKTKRYTVRKSVLQPGQSRICGNEIGEDC